MRTIYSVKNEKILGRVYPAGKIYLSYDWKQPEYDDGWIPFNERKNGVWYIIYHIEDMETGRPNELWNGRHIYCFNEKSYIYIEYKYDSRPAHIDYFDPNHVSYQKYYLKRYYADNT